MMVLLHDALNLTCGAEALRLPGFVPRERRAAKKFRVQPFLKGWREWKGQSPFPGTHFPYFRS